jgi:hypothetical protein
LLVPDTAPWGHSPDLPVWRERDRRRERQAREPGAAFPALFFRAAFGRCRAPSVHHGSTHWNMALFSPLDESHLFGGGRGLTDVRLALSSGDPLVFSNQPLVFLICSRYQVSQSLISVAILVASFSGSNSPHLFKNSIHSLCSLSDFHP